MSGNLPPATRQSLPRYDDPPELRTAHAVRRLASCGYCGGAGDARNMIPMQYANLKEHYHGRCYVARNGLKALLVLPQAVTDRLTLGDIGKETMKALLEKRQ